MINVFASEAAAAGQGFTLGQLLELGVVLSTLALVIATIGLWRATSQVHHDEITKMTESLTHDNDNMTAVTLAEIDSHRLNRERMRQVHHRRHR